MTKAHELAQHGQAVWFDFIKRSFTESGELQKLVERGVRGVTSNPTIFESAIVGSTDYDATMQSLIADSKSAGEIYEALVLEDIAAAADVFRPVYDLTGGADGYVSLEVSPTLARDTQGTIDEARRLFAALGRPNIMIKVPSTPEGVPAIETLIADGINVNVTLIFSVSQYDAIAKAYISGLGKRLAAGKDIRQVASVASFFVSRVDTAVDEQLAALGNTELQGKTAVANAKLAYAHYKTLFSGARWEKLAAAGARVQRPLWASTGTKNPQYSDTLYVDTLIGPDTVNTMPPATLDAFLDHGTVADTVEQGVEQARANVAQLASLGIDLEVVTEELQIVGVDKFAQSFEGLMNGIAAKREILLEGFGT